MLVPTARHLLGGLGVVVRAGPREIGGTRTIVRRGDPAAMEAAGVVLGFAFDKPQGGVLVAHPRIYDYLLYLARLELAAGGLRPADPEPPPPPDVEPALTTWRAIAQAVGVSEDTLARRRAARDPKQRPYFATRREAQEWYADMGRTRPPERRRRGSSTADPIGATLADLRKQKKPR